MKKGKRFGRQYWMQSNFVDNSITGIVAMPYGGCVVAGYYLNPHRNIILKNQRFTIARLDNVGNILWKKNIALPPDVVGAWAFGMIEGVDHNFLIYGNEKNEGSDQFYIKINANGDIIWTRFMNINGSNFKPQNGISLTDGSFVLVGPNESTIISADVFIEKISPDGNILWNKEYNSLNNIELGDIAEDHAGNFMITGYSLWAASPNHYVLTPTFIKASSDGSILWEKNPIIGPFDIAESYCIIPFGDKDFLAGGSIKTDTTEHNIDMLLMMVNNEGEIVWYKNYGAKTDEQVKTPDVFTR
jgi:hypothetical protein